MPAILACLLMFFIPKDSIFVRFWSKDRKSLYKPWLPKPVRTRDSSSKLLKSFLAKGKRIETCYSIRLPVSFGRISHLWSRNLVRHIASRRPRRSSEGLITWKVIHTKMPWRLVFLLGSGFAISKGSSVSGLAMKVGLALVPLKELPPMLMLTVVLFFVGTLTEFTSNVGTANILLPVLAHMVKIHANS